MTDTVKIVSPIDGRVYAERPVASGRGDRGAVAKTRRAREVWNELTVKERAKFLEHFVDALLGKNDEIVPELAWQMGRPVRFGGEKRGVEERARHMIAIAEESLAPSMRPAKDGLRALDRARAAGHGDGDRAVELPVPHGRQLDRAGADGGQCGDPQARLADAAGGRAVRRGVQGGRAARRAVPEPGAQPCRHRKADRLGADRPHQLHRLGGRRAADRAGGGGHVRDARAGARRQGPGLCAGRRQARIMRSRTWSTARSSIRGRAAAASSASMCMPTSTTGSSRASSRQPKGWTLGNPLDAGHDRRTDGDAAVRRPGARADRRGAAQGRQGACSTPSTTSTRRARPISRRRC